MTTKDGIKKRWLDRVWIIGLCADTDELRIARVRVKDALELQVPCWASHNNAFNQLHYNLPKKK